MSVRLTDVQLDKDYDPRKHRQIVEDLRRLQTAYNALEATVVAQAAIIVELQARVTALEP
jgi:hypothetical protein